MKLALAALAALVLAGGAQAADPAAVASYYAGSEVSLVRGANGLYGSTFTAPGSDIRLHEGLYDALYDPDFSKPGRARDVRGPGWTDDAQFWDRVAVQVLLHEAMHQRFPGASEGAVDCAAYLLVPDALQRFYGIAIGSGLQWALWGYHTYQLDCAWFDGHR
jgi:hypothetical protein